jgi:hypothetical protein
MLPSYREYDQAVGGEITRAPPKLRLVLPRSGIGLAGGSTTTPDSVRCIMTQCDVTYEQFFPNGLPRVATVALGFAEVAQVGGTIQFPGRSKALRDEILGGGRASTGYNFIPKSRKSGT